MTFTTFTEVQAASKNNLKNVLERPLIVGASVSADHFTASPGKRLALRHTTADRIKVVAVNGRPGREVLSRVNDSVLKDRSVIIGMDLFFWDTFATSPGESLKAIDKLIASASEKNIPLVLGEVPALMPHMQPSLTAINKRLTDACASYKACKLLPLNQILVKTLTDGFILHEGKKYTLDTLVPDGLHIASPASEFLANEIEKLLI